MSGIDPGVAARLRRGFGAQSMMTTLNASLEALAPGHCSIRAPIGPGVLQQHGVGHAGLAFTIGDSAAGFAALTLLGEAGEVVTAEMKISLMAPARGVALVAEGRVLRAGRRLVTAAADIWALDETGARRHIGAMLGTMVPLAGAPGP